MENYSVLMSVYEKADPVHFEEAMQSILAQTVPTNDFVIVCDGPLTPALSSVLARYDRIEQSDWTSIKNGIKDEMHGYLLGQIKRNPMILPIIMET